MQDRFRCLDTQEKVLLWVLVVVMLAFFVSASLSAQDCPPKPETWPPASTPIPELWWTPFQPRFHGDNPTTGARGSTFTFRCDLNPQTIDLGALKCEDGKWKVYGVGEFGKCDSSGWCDYDSKHQGQSFWTNVYGRYGCGPSGGHGHGIDSYVFPAEDYEKATGKPLVFGSMEHIDTWFHPTLYKWISDEARKKEGPPPLCPNRVCDPGEDSRSCPQDCVGVVRPTLPIPVCGNGNCEAGEESTCLADCPRQQPQPPANLNCNMICNEGDRVCSAEGLLVGGRCPSDCDPCPVPSTPPLPDLPLPDQGSSTCPPCDTLGCSLLIDAATSPLESELSTCRKRVLALESKPKSPLSVDALNVLLDERIRATRGLGACTRFNKSRRFFCQTYICPSNLTDLSCGR